MNPVLAAARGTALDLPRLHLHTHPASLGLCWLHLASAMPDSLLPRVSPSMFTTQPPEGQEVRPPSLLAPHLLRVVWGAVQCLLPDTPYLTPSPPSALLQCHLPDKAQANQACCYHHQLPALPVSLSSCPHCVSHRPSAAACCVCVQSTRMTCTVGRPAASAQVFWPFCPLPTSSLVQPIPGSHFLPSPHSTDFLSFRCRRGRHLNSSSGVSQAGAHAEPSSAGRPGLTPPSRSSLSSPSQSHSLTVPTALPVVQPASWTCARFDGVSNPNL